MKHIIFVLIYSLVSLRSVAQTVHTSIPSKIIPEDNYLFYLHGRIVEEEGAHAISAEYGAYEYFAILDTLKNYGFTVISEVRPKNTNEEWYAEKVSLQIDTLLKAEVLPENIYVVGASKGAFITLFTSVKTKNNKINYVLMGICNEEDHQELASNISPCGNFLSIYETTDPYGGSCQKLLAYRTCVTGFQEVKLSMNNKHGFLYKPYSQWVKPMMDWAGHKN